MKLKHEISQKKIKFKVFSPTFGTIVILMEKLFRYKDILVKNKLGNVEVMDHQYTFCNILECC
jgi:hypothetical protein